MVVLGVVVVVEVVVTVVVAKVVLGAVVVGIVDANMVVVGIVVDIIVVVGVVVAAAVVVGIVDANMVVVGIVVDIIVVPATAPVALGGGRLFDWLLSPYKYLKRFISWLNTDNVMLWFARDFWPVCAFGWAAEGRAANTNSNAHVSAMPANLNGAPVDMILMP